MVNSQPAVLAAFAPRPRVIVGVEGADQPSHALLRGAHIAASIGADVCVVRALGEPHALSRMLFPQRHGQDLADAMARDQDAIAAGAAWCDAVLATPIGARHLVRRGSLVDALREEASGGSTRMVVIAAGSVEPRSAVALANSLRVPVLLARPRSSNPVMVAATDLSHEGYPVLHAAAALAPALSDRLVVLHNTSPSLPGLEPTVAMSVAVTPIVEDLMLGESRVLHEVTRSVSTRAEALHTARSRAADAILDAARACDADLIAIGARHRPSFFRWLTGSTTAAVCRRARRSVLLTPLDSQSSYSEPS